MPIENPTARREGEDLLLEFSLPRGSYATAAALAMIHNDGISAKDVAEKALSIAARICIYTNDSIIVEELG